MKTTSYILLVGLIALLAFTTTQAQIIRVVEPVSFITAGRVYVTLANSAHDSSFTANASKIYVAIERYFHK